MCAGRQKRTVPRKAAARACSCRVETLHQQHACERLQNSSHAQRGAGHFILVQNNHDALVPARPGVCVPPMGSASLRPHDAVEATSVVPGTQHPPASPESLSPSGARCSIRQPDGRRICCSRDERRVPATSSTAGTPARWPQMAASSRQAHRAASFMTGTSTATHGRGQRPCGRIAQLPADQAQKTLLARARVALPRPRCSVQDAVCSVQCAVCRMQCAVCSVQGDTTSGAGLYTVNVGVARSSSGSSRRSQREVASARLTRCTAPVEAVMWVRCVSGGAAARGAAAHSGPDLPSRLCAVPTKLPACSSL
ncbi:hypothetical protein PMIN01_03542 [Paraphaeosphaeria minitans]|uniref:Uncharacterized protein n=1 Tax=Paraphaeosphaeria minitans TaxID=565426 RepID=A0A9P6GQA9_9PLEO|nr:hypothetical protein PMIN01_03542 [Paraphaeosphaeria minitans]